MLRAVRGGLLFGLLGSAAMPALADYVTVISFGGANKQAQEAAFYKPFKEVTGNAVVHGSYNGDLAKLKRMVEISHVSWDVVEVEAPELARGCEEGLFMKLDPKTLGNTADFVPGAVQPCGVGIFVWTTLLAYNQSKLQGTPSSWADFWDTKKFPGKRGLRWGAKYSLEFALMADGVAPKDVYKVLATNDGVDRAFRKLDELKPNINWWKSGQDPVRDLADGTVVMSSAYNGGSPPRRPSRRASAWSGRAASTTSTSGRCPRACSRRNWPSSSSTSPASRSSRRPSPRTSPTGRPTARPWNCWRRTWPPTCPPRRRTSPTPWA